MQACLVLPCSTPTAAAKPHWADSKIQRDTVQAESAVLSWKCEDAVPGQNGTVEQSAEAPRSDRTVGPGSQLHGQKGDGGM